MPEPEFKLLTVFFPMWNEEDNAERAIRAAEVVASELVEAGRIAGFEVLAIDDASTDSTPQLLDELAREDRHLRVIHHPENRKLGGALKTGFAEARGDLVLYTDADLPFDMHDLHRAIRLLSIYEADIASAYRFDRTGEGLKRLIYSHAYNTLVKVMFGLRVRDVNFAFKLIRRRVLDEVTAVSEGSFIDAEILIRAQAEGFHLIQFGVDYFPRTRGTSTLSSPAVIAKLLAEMWSLRSELRALNT